MPEEGEIPPLVQVFVVFQDQFECQNTLRHLAGKSYNGRTVIASYFPEQKWKARDFYGSEVATF
ncbi:hypothetical protein HMI55_004694 [Coelomomyces lativittatus]|nr:hypothetical protein HMI55_004694 [Coelomomyces lativittatus]